MKAVPLLRCGNMDEAISFYTTILDFKLKYPDDPDREWVAVIVNGEAEILLAKMDGRPQIPVYISVDDVDVVFNKYVGRGLKVPNNPDSPVHSGPIDQTWGLREFYVDDPAGNTLRFAAPVR